MKKLIYIFLVMAISTTSFAIEFEKGSEVKDIRPRLLRKLLIQGKTNYEGSKIVIKKGLEIPSSYRKKWDEIKLSGGDIPKEGDGGPGIILITAF